MRVGPSWCGWYGMVQIVCDGVSLLVKSVYGGNGLYVGMLVVVINVYVINGWIWMYVTSV